MKVGFIGLGSQGGPMARRIVEEGYETTLWARRPATLEPFADTAAKIAASPAQLAAATDLVCLCVVGDADIEEITGGEDGLLAAMKPGGVIAVHSTVHPTTCRKIAEGSLASFVDAAGEFVGKDVAVARRIAADLGGDLGALEDLIAAAGVAGKV